MQNQNTSQICVNCVMDTSDTKISFDDRGFCDHCQTFYQQTLPNWPKSDLAKKHLTDMANEIKSNGKKKDFAKVRAQKSLRRATSAHKPCA